MTKRDKSFEGQIGTDESKSGSFGVLLPPALDNGDVQWDFVGVVRGLSGSTTGKSACSHSCYSGYRVTGNFILHYNNYLGGSLVGVWNGWGYGIAFFRALNFQISEPEIW